MPPTVRVFQEHSDALIPRGDEQALPSSLEPLGSHSVLYVDPEIAELVTSIPTKTTLIGDGTHYENCIFQYLSDDRQTMTTEFAELVDTLHVPRTDWNTADGTGQSGHPQSIVESGIFEESWEFKTFDWVELDDEIPTHPLVFTTTEPELPSLNRIRRRALLSEFERGDTQLTLGIKDFETAARLISYILENGYWTSIAVCKQSINQLYLPDVILGTSRPV